MADTKRLLELVNQRQKKEHLVNVSADFKNIATRHRIEFEKHAVEEINENIERIFSRMENIDLEFKEVNEILWEEQALLRVNIHVIYRIIVRSSKKSIKT